ncbi:MAG TPA: SNF2-related protein [Ktedonobacterales bacterium]
MTTKSPRPALPSLPVRVAVSISDGLRASIDQTARASDIATALGPTPVAWYTLRLRAHDPKLRPSFDRLLSPGALQERLRPHPYQLRVVEQALTMTSTGVILADEVGLGKTIEAGLLYTELALRGLAQTVLILAPKSLLPQWQEQLRELFDADFTLTDEKRFSGFESEPRLICSLQQFVRSFDKVRERTFDLVIVDEAHLLANLTSKRRQAVAALPARKRLLLTATPVANKVTDLYSLVDLASPGRLGTPREFENTYIADPGTARAVKPYKVEELRAVVNEVMLRTRRADTGIAFVGRSVETRSISPAPAEDALITDVTAYLRALYRRGITNRANRGAVVREIMALQQSLSSSPQAIEQSLRKRAERHPDERGELLALADRCRGVTSAKEQLFLETLRELGQEPALIFTLRLETAARLRAVARSAGRSAETYVGALNRAERERLVRKFNAGALTTLIATDAGAEGLNLQERCRTVINLDLNWNPLKIEQRIGRVHRLGQMREVRVINMALQDTIDDYVVRLLYEKINLFTLTIGALETVLAETQDDELDLEERLLEILLEHDNQSTIREGVRALGDEMASAQERQLAAEALTAEVLR